jgi:hypothetical protein
MHQQKTTKLLTISYFSPYMHHVNQTLWIIGQLVRFSLHIVMFCVPSVFVLASTLTAGFCQGMHCQFLYAYLLL